MVFINRINVAVIGTGFIGRQHIEAIRRSPMADLVALVGIDENALSSMSQLYGIEHTFATIDDLLASELKIDLIHNCTPNGMHYEINKKAILAGVNVYCEKPLTLTLEESEELVKLAEEKGVKCGVNFNYRQNIMVEEMRQRVKENGTPWFVDAAYLQDWLLFQDDFDWRVDKKIGGESRAVADIGSHCFDTIQYILDSRITTVEAKLFRKFDSRSLNGEAKQVDNEDAGLIFVEFENGSKGIIRVSQVTAGKKNDLQVRIDLDNDCLEWHQEKPDRLWVGKRNEGNQEIYASQQYLSSPAAAKAILPNGHAVGWADAFALGINNFHRAVMGEENTNYVSFAQGAYIMKIVEAVIESNKIHQKVEL